MPGIGTLRGPSILEKIMRCPHCSAENPVNSSRCRTCGLDRTSPLIWPHLPAYAVRKLGVVAAAAVAVCSLLAVVAGALSFESLWLARLGAAQRDPGLVERAHRLEEGLLRAEGVAMLVAGVLVIAWFSRARRNLDAFPEARPSISAGWAIGGWLVPFAHFVLPYRIMKQIAAASLRGRATGRLVGWWWGAYLVGMLTTRLMRRLRPDGGFPAHVEYFVRMREVQLVAAVAMVAAGVLLVRLIVLISGAQTDRIARARAARSLSGARLGG
ncbi:DUF4328 domain-containing protein [Catellatospora sp. KI3]|uniref:DUF4328 domain-containing protein n=1 Tax=Catellatospora sp. KI3 TaxID=3041620 RepID=UPI002482D812|nr:DUF4328 domain-containing protein [Catellatospora sp. KI3]MDI1460437.1 DUF4328 domain-containing protein [Catellatospora sp. KI3]